MAGRRYCKLTVAVAHKPKVLVETKGLGREDWLKWRKNGIGGSDAPGILGKNPFSSPFNVWQDKLTGEISQEENEAIEWGIRLEPVLAEKFMDEHPELKLRNRNAILQHPEYPFMLADVDRLVVGEDAGWEGKTTNAFYKDVGVPREYYEIQCQHYMAVTGRPKWYISVLAGGQKYYEYVVYRDEEFINTVLIPAEEYFWYLVQNEIIPDIDGSQGCTDYLSNLYPAATADNFEMPEDVLPLVEQLLSIGGQEKELKATKDELTNKIKKIMGEHSKGVVGDYKVYWSNVSTKKFDSKLFQTENPDIYEKYIKESNYRRFQIK
jgi:putative phage-type endonuclease